MAGLVPAIHVFLLRCSKDVDARECKADFGAPETDIRNQQSPFAACASQLIGKARIAETLGEGGEVLLPTKQISQIGGAQIGITFECL
jgi:hypothetical protein